LRVLVAEQLRVVQQRMGELQSLEHQLAEIHQRLMMTDSRSRRTKGCGCLEAASRE
jgi:hypothetical protein